MGRGGVAVVELSVERSTSEHVDHPAGSLGREVGGSADRSRRAYRGHADALKTLVLSGCTREGKALIGS